MNTLPARIGMIGCGNISKQYFTVAQRLPTIEIAAVADLRREAAEAAAAQWNIPRVLGVDELLADPEIDIVLNLTIPGAHFSVAKAALEAGKSVYSEKPLALRASEGQELLELAAAKGLRIGCAPDTFLGGGLQSARKLIDDGVIDARRCLAWCSASSSAWRIRPAVPSAQSSRVSAPIVRICATPRPSSPTSQAWARWNSTSALALARLPSLSFRRCSRTALSVPSGRQRGRRKQLSPPGAWASTRCASHIGAEKNHL